MTFRPLLRAALVALAGSAAFAHAQSATPAAYPSQSIRIIIPTAPGGGTDYIARTLATQIQQQNPGWNLVPDNRPGAGTALGLAEAARAAPTGYDIVLGQTDNVSLIPQVMKVSYDPARDLSPVSLVATTPIVIVVPADSPYKTLGELIDAARAKPESINYGTSGTGGSVHIAVELLQAAANFKMQHVPYKGSAPALTDLVGGHLQMAGTSIASAASLLQANKVRALAVTAPTRSPALPDVPTVAEQGYKDFDFSVYYGVFAPAGTPQPVIDSLNRAVNQALAQSEVQENFRKQGLEPKGSTAQGFAELVSADIARVGEVIRSANIKVTQ